MSTTTTPSQTSTNITVGPSATGTTAITAGGGKSSLYLFTFLITIVVLGLISGGLLFRAYYIRRQFQRRVEEAIRAGQPLPNDAAAALGLLRGTARRGKKEKQHGPMPSIWEAEMWRDDKAAEGAQGTRAEVDKRAEWEGITPLCLTRDAPPIVPPPPPDPATLFPNRGPWYLRPFRRAPPPDLSAYAAQHPPPGPPALNREVTRMTLPPVRPVWTVPEEGEEVMLGVLIAMPVEGKDEDLWKIDERDEEESPVPQVCLGLMGGTMRN